MPENATKTFVKSEILEHAQDWTKRLKEAMDKERESTHNQVNKCQDSMFKLDSKIEWIKDWVKNNDKEIWLNKLSNSQMIWDIKEIKEDIKAHSTTLENFLEKIEKKFVTKSEYKIVVWIIWFFWSAFVVWLVKYAWDNITNLQ